MKFISILRGINVGGNRKILMADLKFLYASLGYSNVISYIQSGNVIFDGSQDAKTIELAIENKIKEVYDFDVPVIVRSQDEISKILTNNIYITDDNYDIERLHYTFLQDFPKDIDINKTMQFEFDMDKFSIVDKGIYGYCSGRYSDSKLTNNFFESKLKVRATTRNWKTMKKLLELSSK